MKRLGDIHGAIEARVGTGTLKLVRYLISGGTAALVNWGALFLLVDIGKMYYLYASVLSFVVSIGASFIMQKFWTFRDHLVHDIHLQFTRYLVVIFLSLALNTAIVYLLVDKVKVWYLLAQVIATVIIAITNFFWYKHFVFRERVVHAEANSIS